MKLHLLVLLASVLTLSSGFTAELEGTLAEEVCTGEEYSDFKHCVTLGANVTDVEDVAVVNSGGDRRLNCYTNQCLVYKPGAGHFCFYMCGHLYRRRLEQGTDTPNLRRVQEADSAVFEGGDYTGTIEAIEIAEDIIDCLGDLSAHHPCLGRTVDMRLTVTL
jgi:hypothetical protein